MSSTFQQVRGVRLTVLVHVELVDRVDVRKSGNAGLDFCPTLACRLVDALNHLLLPVDPVEVIPEHREAHWLQYVRVFDHNPIGACREGEKNVQGNETW